MTKLQAGLGCVTKRPFVVKVDGRVMDWGQSFKLVVWWACSRLGRIGSNSVDWISMAITAKVALTCCDQCLGLGFWQQVHTHYLWLIDWQHLGLFGLLVVFGVLFVLWCGVVGCAFLSVLWIVWDFYLLIFSG